MERHREYTAQRSYEYEVRNKAGVRISTETQEEWKERVLNEWSVLGFDKMAMIFHEFDCLENGKQKPLHVHGVFVFKEPMFKETALKLLNCSLPTNVSHIKNFTSACRYLTHITEQAIKDGKYIYSEGDVYTFNCTYNELIRKR